MARGDVEIKDWLHSGLMQFAAGGASNVKVEQMAKELDCSKGSFYWHFKTRDEFFDAMLDYWVDLSTEEFIRISLAEANPHEQLSTLVRKILPSREGKDFYFHIRAFARKDKKAAKILKQAEDRRITFVTDLLIQLGKDAVDAREKAEIFYNYYLGWYERSKHTRLNHKNLQLQLERISKILELPLSGARS